LIKTNEKFGSFDELKAKAMSMFRLTDPSVTDKDVFVMGKYDGSSLVVFYRNGNPYMIVSRGNDVSGISQWSKFLGLVPHNIDPNITEVYGELVVPISKGNRSQANGYMNAIEFTPGSAELKIFGCAGKTAEARFEFMRSHVYEITGSVMEMLMATGQMNDIPFDGCCIYCSKTHQLFINKIYFTESQTTQVIGYEKTFSDKTGTWSAVLRLNPVKLNGTNVKKVKAGPYKKIINDGLGVGATVKMIKSGNVIPKVDKVLVQSNNFEELLKCDCCKEVMVPLGSDIICSNPQCKNTVNWMLRRIASVYLGDDVTTLMIGQDKFGMEEVANYIKTHGKKDNNEVGIDDISYIITSPRFTGIEPGRKAEIDNEIKRCQSLTEKAEKFKDYLKSGLQKDHHYYVMKTIKYIADYLGL
jgi:hypothetical protein